MSDKSQEERDAESIQRAYEKAMEKIRAEREKNDREKS